MLFPIRFWTCQKSIESKAAALAANLGSATSGYITDASMGTIYKTYQLGAVYCHNTPDGAHAV